MHINNYSDHFWINNSLPPLEEAKEKAASDTAPLLKTAKLIVSERYQPPPAERGWYQPDEDWTAFKTEDLIAYGEEMTKTINRSLFGVSISEIKHKMTNAFIDHRDKVENNHYLETLIGRPVRAIFNSLAENRLIQWINYQSQTLDKDIRVFARDTSQRIHNKVIHIKEHPKESLKRTAVKVQNTAIKAIEKLPWVGVAVPVFKLVNILGHKSHPEYGDIKTDLKHEIKRKINRDIKSTASFTLRTIPKVGQSMLNIPKVGMNIALYAGIGFSSQAVAALSTMTIVASTLGIVVGGVGAVGGGLKMLHTGYKGAQLIHMRYKVHQLRKKANQLEAVAESMDPKSAERAALMQYVRLYREEAFVLRDFAKSERREIATRLIKSSLFIAGNIALVGAGTCAIVAVSGYGAPICLPLSLGLSVLASAFFIAEYGVSGVSKGAGKLWDIRKERQLSDISERQRAEYFGSRSTLGTGVAKSHLGIATRAAMLADIEGKLQRQWDTQKDFLEQYDIEKPNAAKKYIIHRYMGTSARKMIKKNRKRQTKAIKSYTQEKSAHREELDKYRLEKEAIEKALENSDERAVEFQKVLKKDLKALEFNAPDEIYNPIRGLWTRLRGKGPYKEWVAGMKGDPLFNAEFYNPKFYSP